MTVIPMRYPLLISSATKFLILWINLITEHVVVNTYSYKRLLFAFVVLSVDSPEPITMHL